MNIKVAKKYFNSRIDGVLIRCLDVNEETGKVVIINERGDEKEYWVDPEKTAVHTADYILCDLQDNPELTISKY